MAQLLLGANATVTICHSRTRDLAASAARADVLVAAVGRAAMVEATGSSRARPSSTSASTGPTTASHGDVAFDAVAEVAGAITPVPGGVGPMTIACLLRNTLLAAQAAKA